MSPSLAWLRPPFRGATFTIPPRTITNPIVNGASADVHIDDRDLDGVTDAVHQRLTTNAGDASMVIDLPSYPDGHLPSVVIIELQVGNAPYVAATIEALDCGGTVVATYSATTPARTTAIVAATEIEKVRVRAVETAVFRICWY